MNELELFEAALDIRDPRRRSDFLDRSCPDPELRRRLDSLLAAHEQSDDFLAVPAVRQILHGRHTPPPGVGATGADQRTRSAGVAAEIDLAFLAPPQRPDSLGRLGHYEVLEVVGRGGCGIVLKAFDEKLLRVVAVKIMAPELAAASPARKRFLREARTTAAVRHENVVSIYAVEEQPLPFLVMEFIDGCTLQEKLDRDGPLEPSAVLRIGRQIAAGLEAAHAQGLIHRDVKPGNILLARGSEHVKLTDFGLARSVDDASLTQSGVVSGTPLYMSPEQAQGNYIDHRSDLFSLGSVLYVMCSGRPPFRAGNTLAVMKRVVEDEPRPISQIIPETPAWLIQAVARLHAKRPEDRPASAGEVVELLAELQARWERDDFEPLPASLPESTALPTGVPPSRTPAVGTKRPLVRRVSLAAAGLIVLVTALGISDAAGMSDFRGTIVRWFSPAGTLVLEIDDPDVSVTLDGGELRIAGAGPQEIRLRPGPHELQAHKDGRLVQSEWVSVERDGRQVVRVLREPPQPPLAATPATASSMQPFGSAPADASADDGDFRDMAPRVSPRAPDFISGNWTLLDDELEQSDNRRGIYLLMFGDRHWSHYDLTVETMTLPGSDKIEGANILFGVRSPDDYQVFSLGGYNGTFNEIYFRERGRWGRNVNLRPTQHRAEHWYQVRIEARGSYFRCFLDGELLVEFEDDRFRSGAIGLGAWNSSTPVRWRNLQVTSPEGETLWAGFPDLPIEVQPFDRAEREALEQVLALGGRIAVVVDGEQLPSLAPGDSLPEHPFRLNALNLSPIQAITDADLEILERLRNLPEVQWIALLGPHAGDAALDRLSSIPGFAAANTLNLAGTQITDQGLAALARFPRLQHLVLSQTLVSVRGLQRIESRDMLSLNLRHCREIDDEACRTLAAWPHLLTLFLDGTSITDAGVRSLAEAPQLQVLQVRDCPQVTKEAIERLSQVRPRCRIVWNGGIIDPLEPQP